MFIPATKNVTSCGLAAGCTLPTGATGGVVEVLQPTANRTTANKSPIRCTNIGSLI
jgi:hypothetical protein